MDAALPTTCPQPVRSYIVKSWSSPTFTTAVFWQDCQSHQTILSAHLSISCTAQTADNRLPKDSVDMNRDLAARIPRFRALVVGRANAGKTTLLRCIAQSADGRVCTSQPLDLF